MSDPKLFEYHELDPDCFISGRPEDPDTPQENYLCWKQIAGLALSSEFVVCGIPEQGYEFRIIPQFI